MIILLASFGIFHAIIITVEKLSIKQLHSYHSEDEMKEKVNYENVENILQ